jgi:hypothetical protein
MRAALFRVALVALVALPACGEARLPAARATLAADVPDDASASPAPSASAVPAAPPSPVSSSAMPPPTPKKAGCLDSTRGAKHTFVG